MRYEGAVPIPSDFERESLYDPRCWFVHDVEALDEERVVGIIDTTRLGLLVDAQIVRPTHPRHLPGAIVVQVTGTLGNLHAVYGLGLRVSEGWAGFGTHLDDARFHSMGTIGPSVRVEMTLQGRRFLRGTHFLSYTFSFTQDDRIVYTSRQRAVWTRAATD